MTQNLNNEITLYYSDVQQKKTNTSYPYRMDVTCVDDLAKVAKFDHVCGLYKDKKNKSGEIIKVHRANADFLETDNVSMDCDNKNDNPLAPDILPEQWKKPADVKATFPNVAFYAIPSRNNMKEKDGFSPRPKHHYYFKLKNKITDPLKMVKLKNRIQQLFPAFDDKALDAARFMFGVENPQPEYFDGELCIDEYIERIDGTKKEESSLKFNETIPVGARNSTLSRFAATVLKKYGNEDGKAYNAFVDYASKCEQPLSNKELATIWNSAKGNYIRNTKNAPDYVPPKEYASRDFADRLQPYDYTDIGQANVLAATCNDKLKFTPATKFIVYNDAVWQESETKAQALAQELTEKQIVDARKKLKKARAIEDAAAENNDETGVKEAKKLVKYAENYRAFVLNERGTSRVKAALCEARPKLEIAVDDLDHDAYLLNTPGGAIDLNTGEIRKHNPEDFCTKITAVAPSSDNAELFKDFLQRITCNDSDLERYLQEVAGMCAIGKVLKENIIIAYGEGGNGKSTLFNLLFRVMGDYGGSLSAETLTVNCRKNKSPEYAELRGKRIIIAAELEEGMRLDTAIVKKLCSIDPIQAEKKFKDPFTFVPSHTVILYTNHLPKIGTIDKGTWDRIVTIPFMANLRGAKGEILNYCDYLFTKAGGAVLSWVVAGAKRFIANNYKITMPECVKDAINRYHANNDWLENFLHDSCDIDRIYTAKSGELYEEYRNYCNCTGDYRRSLADFKAALTGAGFDSRKTKTGAFVYGLRLKPDFLNEENEPERLSNIVHLPGKSG